MTTTTNTVPTTFRSAHQLGALAALAEGAGMDLRTVYSLASEDNLVMAVRRYVKNKEEQRKGQRLMGTYAQRLLALRTDHAPYGPEHVRHLRQLHALRREGW